MAEKLDFKKAYKAFYSPKAAPELVTVPALQFLMVDGRGAPEGDEYQQAVPALYSLAYTIKFDRKKRGLGPDYTMGPLEGLWAFDDGSGFDPGKTDEYMARRDKWVWTALLWQPDFIGDADLERAKAQLAARRPDLALDKIRLESFEEGKAVQIMHTGPYAEEPASVAKLEAYVAEQGLTMYGRHHEIYLGDPRTSAPEKLKTIIRHPVKS